MSKLFVAVAAFSTVSLAVGHQGLSLDVFLNNPKIKLLSNPGVKGAYPGDEDYKYNYDDLLKALAAVQEPITLEKVKGVLKKHASELFGRLENAEAAFIHVRDSIGPEEPRDVVAKVGQLLEKYYLVGMHINEQAKEVEELYTLYNGLNGLYKGIVDDALAEAAEAVEKGLYYDNALEKLPF